MYDQNSKGYYFILCASFFGPCRLIFHWQPAAPTNQVQIYCKNSLHIVSFLWKTNVPFDSYFEQPWISSPCIQYGSQYCYFNYRSRICYFNFYESIKNTIISYRQICVLATSICTCMGTYVYGPSNGLSGCSILWGGIFKAYYSPLLHVRKWYLDHIFVICCFPHTCIYTKKDLQDFFDDCNKMRFSVAVSYISITFRHFTINKGLHALHPVYMYLHIL